MPLGRTGLTVSVAGLGCGGFSRLGQATGSTESESVAVVRRALELGVTFVDTAAVYGTEPIVGRAIAAVDRGSVVISTKAHAPWTDPALDPGRIVRSLDRSLERLGTDHVDVFHLHGVPPAAYSRVLDSVVPVVVDQRDAGKLRAIGITEMSSVDPGHEMLRAAVAEEPWDVVMLAFHLMHHGAARQQVLPTATERGVGTLAMFVVRSIFSRPDRLRTAVDELVAAGDLPPDSDRDHLLDFLVHDDGGGRTLMDAAYRFARHEPGIDVTLFGTGDPGHVESNVASILSPPLPDADLDRVGELFGHLSGVGLDVPPEAARLPR